MTGPAFNQGTQDLVLPYLTRDQYRCAPTCVDTQNLVRGGAQADQDAALDRLIMEASAWCDNMAEQPLTAQTSVEVLRAAVAAGGILRLHPKQHPIVSVNALSYGVDATMMSAMTDLSNVWVEDQSIEVPLQAAISGGFSGPLQFNTARPGNRVRVVLTYVAGWAVTTLASPALLTDSTVTVKDATGITPGTHMRVEQGGAPIGGGSTQTTLVNAKVTVLSVAGNVVTLTAPIGVAFAAGAAFTALTSDLEQAGVYAVTGLIKQRGTGALTMGGKNATVPKDSTPGAEEFDEAEAILSSYRPVAP